MVTAAELDGGASAALARVDALHTGLTGIVLEGGDLDGIAAEVARVLDVGVVFTSTDGRERAAALPDPLRTALAEAELVDPTGRLRVERVGPEGVRVADGDVRVLRVAAGGPTWPGWSACARVRRSRPTTCTPWSGRRPWRRC